MPELPDKVINTLTDVYNFITFAAVLVFTLLDFFVNRSKYEEVSDNLEHVKCQRYLMKNT